MTKLGSEIRRARQAAGMTEEALGFAAGADDRLIRRLENGETPNPGIGTVLRILRVLNLPIGQVVEWGEGNEKAEKGVRMVAEKTCRTCLHSRRGEGCGMGCGDGYAYWEPLAATAVTLASYPEPPERVGDVAVSAERLAELEAERDRLAAEVKRLAAENIGLQHDIDAIDHEVSRVYCHITDQRISKCNTLAREVIAVADDIVTKTVDEEAERLTRPVPRPGTPAAREQGCKCKGRIKGLEYLRMSDMWLVPASEVREDCPLHTRGWEE